MIKLTDKHGDPVLVNIKKSSYIEEYNDERTLITFNSCTLFVRESVEEIERLIKLS